MEHTPDGTFTFPGTDLTVNRMGYGAMQLAGPGVYGPPKDWDKAIEVLQAAVEAGVNHIDTSDFYGPHVVNKLIREALYPYPKELVLVTKIGARREADKSWHPAQGPTQLRSAVEDNLRNLGVETLDVVNMRLWGEAAHGPKEEPIGHFMEIVATLQKEGKIRHIGLSNCTLNQVHEAQQFAPIVCVQNMYNLVQRHDDRMVDELAAQGVAFVPFFPLGGFSPLQSSELDALAKEKGVTPMQLALAWLLQRSPNILLIPGTSSVDHLNENMTAAELHLDADTRSKLDAIGSK